MFCKCPQNDVLFAFKGFNYPNINMGFLSCSVLGIDSANIFYHACPGGGGGGTPLCDLNGDMRPDRVWFIGCFVLNGVSISSLSVLNRVSLHDLMA